MQVRMPVPFKSGPAKNRKRVIFLTCQSPIKELQLGISEDSFWTSGQTLIGRERCDKIYKLHRLDALGGVCQKRIACRIFVARARVGGSVRQAAGMRLCNQFSSWAGWHAVGARAVATCQSRHGTETAQLGCPQIRSLPSESRERRRGTAPPSHKL